MEPRLRPVRLARSARIRGAETHGAPGPGLGCLMLAIARRRRGGERFQQLARRIRHAINGLVECQLVRLGGPREPTQLPDELYGGCADLLLCRGRLEIVERSNVTAHGQTSSFIASLAWHSRWYQSRGRSVKKAARQALGKRLKVPRRTVCGNLERTRTLTPSY